MVFFTDLKSTIQSERHIEGVDERVRSLKNLFQTYKQNICDIIKCFKFYYFLVI